MISIYVSSAFRGLATGYIAIAFALYIHDSHLGAAQLGYFVSLGLASGAMAVAAVTFWGDRFGRRRTYFLLTLLMLIGGIGLTAWVNPIWIGFISFIGLLNGMGRDRGAQSILDQAILPRTTAPEKRTYIYAWYNLIQDVSLAVGAFIAGAPALIHQGFFGLSWAPPSSILAYPVLIMFSLLSYFFLPADIEIRSDRTHLKISTRSKIRIRKLMLLFGLDAMSTGFMATAFLAYFFHQKFGISVGTLGVLFAVARLLNAISHPLAAWIAKRIGLVNTMVFTHLPSSLLMVAAALAPGPFWAMSLFLLRELLVQMDVPTRQSYVMAIVNDHERTSAAGLTQIVRMIGWAIPPAIGGFIAVQSSLAIPIVIGCSIKISYDLALYVSFRNIRPVEEAGYNS